MCDTVSVVFCVKSAWLFEVQKLNGEKYSEYIFENIQFT